MTIPTDRKYSKTHEWVKPEADGGVTVGITHHAQDMLGDMVFVEPPAAGRQLAADEECGVVESVKSASDLYAPVSGAVIAVNDEVENTPEKINQDPYGAWIFKLKPDNPAELDKLLDAGAYQALADSEAH
ncbi:MAG TPA: glycine cleavage system protein GcvH [Betaproteobacteria bacterium]|nr:glycine cleavage system protein GcvH [Betaproteobacteria bacterium]